MIYLDTSALIKLYLLEEGSESARLGCRTMDIFHVACALQIGAIAFIPFDDRQRSLAEFAKLQTG